MNKPLCVSYEARAAQSAVSISSHTEFHEFFSALSNLNIFDARNWFFVPFLHLTAAAYSSKAFGS